MQWTYEQPVEIIFGTGKIKELAQILSERGYQNGLLVSDPYFVTSGLAEEIVTVSDGRIKNVFSNVSPNPDVTEVDACADIIREHKSEFILALGGGSAMDLAKAASTVSLTEHSICKYHGTGVAMSGEHLPIVAVPTTSGTGSEVTRFAVLTDKELGKKAPIATKAFYPEIALVDPVLTYTVPASITASTGIDVLSHALEGYWSKGHQPICDALAVHAIDLVMTYLPIACTEPENVMAREKMSEASIIAGLVFSMPLTTSSHACSYPLTNIYKIPHGEACGLTLDYFTKINAKYDDGRVLSIAKKLGYASGEDFAEAIRLLKQTVGVRMNLKDLKLDHEAVDELVRLSKHPNLLNNPVEITEEMLYDMYNGMI